jgi:hypothetical protein
VVVTEQVHLAQRLGLSSIIFLLLLSAIHGNLWGDLYLHIFYVSQNSEILGMKRLGRIEGTDIVEIFQ